jgi:hypothetical protein
MDTSVYKGVKPRLLGFLSNHESNEEIASIITEPEKIYFEDARDSVNLNFDFKLTGKTKKQLIIKFIARAQKHMVVVLYVLVPRP